MILKTPQHEVRAPQCGPCFQASQYTATAIAKWPIRPKLHQVDFLWKGDTSLYS